MTDDPIPDKVRAQVLRETADDLAEHHFFDGAADVLHREANRLDPPEFEDGDYAVWDRYGGRWPAVRCNAVWSVAAHMNRCSDVHMREHYERIERLRVAGEDQVIVDADVLHAVLDSIASQPPQVLDARDHLITALAEQTGGEQ